MPPAPAARPHSRLHFSPGCRSTPRFGLRPKRADPPFRPGARQVSADPWSAMVKAEAPRPATQAPVFHFVVERQILPVCEPRMVNLLRDPESPRVVTQLQALIGSLGGGKQPSPSSTGSALQCSFPQRQQHYCRLPGNPSDHCLDHPATTAIRQAGAAAQKPSSIQRHPPTPDRLRCQR